jgi:hypothetical protein
MVGLGVSWARPLQGFSIVLFIIAVPTKLFHDVNLAVVIASTLALEVVTAIAVLISVVAPITIVVTAPVIVVVIVSWRVQCFTSALVQQLLGVIGVCILLGGGEEVNHRYRPFTKELVPKVIVVAQTYDEGFNRLVVGDPRDPDAHI